MGKTWFALNLLKNISVDQNIPSALFSLEMSENEIVYRLISLCSGIHIYKIQNGKMNEEELNQVALAIQKIESSPIFINDSPANGLLRNLSESMSSINNDSQIIIIDHIGLVRANDSSTGNNRATEVGAITRTIKIHAKEYKVPIMCLAQLNRGAEK